jgi:hypothetical protein
MSLSARVLWSLFLLSLAAAGESAEVSLWRVQLDAKNLGPVEFHMQLEESDGMLRGTSLSGAVDILAGLPGKHEVSNGLMAFEASAGTDNMYRGEIVAPWRKGEVRIEVCGDSITGAVDGGIFSGPIVGQKVSSVEPIRDYMAVLKSLDAVVSSKIYSADDIKQPAYQDFRETLGEIAAAAHDDLDLLLGFHWAWTNEAFSHFELKRSARSAQQMFSFFDSYRVGFEAATVEFDGNIAILKVRTMMGLDTIEQIEAAYERIAEKEPKALIVDLRGNSGGAFAVKPLVEHVIDSPVDAGYFISQVWNRSHDKLPSFDKVRATAPWHGWSITAFWESVQNDEIVRVQFDPASPNYDGPVFVLVDSDSASATEMAADAFKSSGATTIIGQQTAGQMLSQSMFDVAGGFIVSLPVADYYSMSHGRIEGVGVTADIPARSEDALTVARQLAREAISR